MNSIFCIEAQSDLRWQEFVGQRSSRVFHSPDWLRVLATTYELDVKRYLLLDENGAVVAGLPACRVVDFKRERVVTLPFSDYCDPLVDDMTQWDSLVEELTQWGCPLAI